MKKIFLVLLFGFIFLFLGACNLQNIANNIGGDGDGDGGSDDGTTLSEEHKSAEVENKVKELKDDKGFYIKYKVSSTSSDSDDTEEILEYGANKDLYYYNVGYSEIVVDLSDKTKMVSYDKEEDGWYKTELVYAELGMTEADAKEMMESYFLAISGYMTMYQAYEGMKMTKTSGTVAGRSCDKYSQKDATIGAAVSYSFYIDKATGICLKWEVSGVSTEGSGSASFECLEFKTSYNVTVPTDIAGGYE